MILLIPFTLLALCFVRTQAQRDERFNAIVKKCNHEFTWEKIAHRDVPRPYEFFAYGNTTARNEADCARRCYERTDFCRAAIYEQDSRTCIFSYKYIPCPKDGHQRSIPRSGQHIIHCIRCSFLSDLQRVKTPKRPQQQSRNQFVRKPEPERARARGQTVRIRTTTTAKTTTTTGPKPSPIPGQVTQLSATSVNATNSNKSLDEMLRRELDKEWNPLMRNPPSKPNAQSIESMNRFQRERLESIVNKTSSKTVVSTCAPEMQKPCSEGFGRGCAMVEHSVGCDVCSCPYKSPARGCAGPQGLTEQHRTSMLVGHEPCPNNERMQVVHRWYRKKTADFDDCVIVKEPYCGWLQDVNIWRMPRTKDECLYFCYTDQELIRRGHNFFRL